MSLQACQPKTEKPAHFAGFFAFWDFLGFDFFGSGGVANILRNTASIDCEAGSGFGVVMAGV